VAAIIRVSAVIRAVSVVIDSIDGTIETALA
jgi:hypothetical protein